MPQLGKRFTRSQAIRTAYLQVRKPFHDFLTMPRAQTTRYDTQTLFLTQNIPWWNTKNTGLFMLKVDHTF